MGKRENIATVVKRARTITNYINNHDSLLKKKVRLKQLFTSDDWANHNFSHSNASHMVEKVYPTMRAIYKLMRVVKDDLESKHGARLGVGDDGTLIRVVHNVYSKLDPASPAVGQFGNELTWF
ncbi:hypothetical protein ACFX15_042707 [Malus domestica]